MSTTGVAFTDELWPAPAPSYEDAVAVAIALGFPLHPDRLQR